MNEINQPAAICVRCQRSGLFLKTRLNDGHVCSACLSEAFRNHGTCSRCSHEGLVPGRTARGGFLCGRCSKVRRAYVCSRCSKEWWLVHGLCEWCYLSDRIDLLFEDGSVDLQRLKESLCAVARPDSIIIWLYNKNTQTVLSELSNGERPVSHEGLDAYPRQRIANHVRGLLIQCGLLEPRDETLAKFDRWTATQFPPTRSVEDRRLLVMFTKWHQRPSLQAKPGTDSRMRGLCQEIRVAAQFLDFAQTKDETAATLSQATIDEWWAIPPTTHRRCRPFLRWAISTQHVNPKLKIPTVIDKRHKPLTQTRRLEHLTAMLDPQTGPLNARAAGTLLLLLAQPFHKMVKLKVSDVVATGDDTSIRIGLDPCPIPSPFDKVLTAQASSTSGRNTATNSASQWLFPGRTPAIQQAHPI